MGECETIKSNDSSQHATTLFCQCIFAFGFWLSTNYFQNNPKKLNLFKKHIDAVFRRVGIFATPKSCVP